MPLNSPVEAFLSKSQGYRPVLSIDVDNTLAFFSQHLLAVINAQFDTNYKAKDQKQPGLHFLKGPELSYAIKQHSNPAFYATMAPDYAAIAAVQAMQDAGYYVIVASSRPDEMLEATMKWLNRWGVPYNECFVGANAKVEVASRATLYDHVIFVDDNPNLLDDINRPGCSLRLLQRPYTGDIKNTDKVKVVDTWLQILQELEIPQPTKIPQLNSPPLGWKP